MRDGGWKFLFRYGSRGIFVRIMVLAMVLILVSALYRQLVLAYALRPDIDALAAAQQHSTADYIARDVDEKIRLRLDLLQRWSLDLPINALDQPLMLRQWLRSRVTAALFFPEGLTLFSTDGRKISGLAGPEGDRISPDNVLAIDWFQDALTGQGPVIGTPTRGGSTARPVLTLATPVRDRTGQTVAILAGTTTLLAPHFLDLLQQQKIGQTGGVLLIDPRHNLIVVSTNAAKTLSPAAPPGVNQLHDRARAGFRGTDETVSADGHHVLATVTSVDSANWFIVVQQPLSEVLKPVDHLSRTITQFSLLMMAGTLGLLSLILPKLLRPLTDAAQQLNAMASGDKEIGPLPVQRQDEIGAMATGFNFLLAKLREKEQALRDSEAHMAHMAHHDPLTGLPNRALFEDRLSQLLINARRNGQSLAVLYLDLDGFKPVNDRFGHRAGDEVLRQTARRLTDLLRKVDTVARIGGDEFAILLDDVASHGDDVALVVEKCRAAVGQPIPFEDVILSVGISIGIALFPRDGDDLDRLLKYADDDMYRTKRGGRMPG